MKRTLLIAAIFVCIAQIFASAQNRTEQRKKWMEEMTNAKIEFMNKELDITGEQKEDFNKLYKAYLAELHKVHHETRKLEKSIDSKKNATDLEYEKAAEAMFELKGKEGDVNEKYFDQFKQILTPNQLFKFQKAESHWAKHLMKHRKKRTQK